MAPVGSSVKNSLSSSGEPHRVFRSWRSYVSEISDLTNVDYNCPADNPPEWVRTVRLALAGIQ